ncbi:DUF87 domain-containing protein (plasmid) [Oscillospiraceae bacterium MB08-C2-2]|nr:DUF87 domain-containing protein [Oscillospiraceae bacterium MB08-C2-2]
MKKNKRIDNLINFRILESSVATPFGVAQFLRILPPNLSVMTKSEREAEIDKLEALLDAATIPFQIFIMDKIEDLSANKEYYENLKAGSEYEYIIDSILESVDKIESDNSAVQRAYYLVVITKDREEFTLFKNLVAEHFAFYQADRQEIATLLRNFILREFIGLDVYALETEIKNSAKAKDKRHGKSTDPTHLLGDELSRRLTPQKLKFTPQRAVQNDFYRKTILIKNFPSMLDTPCFLSSIAQIKNTTLSIRLGQMNEVQAVGLIDSQMNNIKAKGNRAKTSEQIQSEVEQESMRTFYRNLAKNNSKLYFINIYIEVYASTEEELRKRIGTVKSKLSAFRITTENLTYDQLEGFQGVYPLGKDVLGSSANNMPSPTIAGMFPFSHSYHNDPQGILLGSTADGGHMFLDLWQRVSAITNGNFSITGDSGQGKSWLMKKINTQMIIRGITCFSLDPDGEYNEMFYTVGGTVVDCASGTIKINAFEIRRLVNQAVDGEDSELEAFRHKAVFFQHLSWLKDFFRVLFPEITTKELNALMILTQDMYRKYGISENTDVSTLSSQQYPTFTSLYEYVSDVLECSENYNYSMISTDMIKSLLLLLRDTYDGSLGLLLNGHTNIKNSRMINFDISQLRTGSEERTQAVLFNIMTYCWNRISRREEQILFDVDELHLLMNRKNYIIAGYLRDFQKRARKYDAIIGTATQSLRDFLDPEMMHITAPLLNNAAFKFIFHPGDLDLERVQNLLDLSDGEITCIKKPKQGHCLLKAGGQKYSLNVGKLPYEESLFGKGGGR